MCPTQHGPDVQDIWTLGGGTDELPETSIADQPTLQNSPEKGRTQPIHGESLKLKCFSKTIISSARYNLDKINSLA